ncbi:MAG: cytochrome C [Gammaproteobacteria bacterium RIFOXYA12_FULL_61_12]|nr:MAG: cytochrome C [Gammaproteobacteria bacterium RIFOXYD12_FULL_61_37]OGT93746.1 MAG: cytochrome C [Gammaproteobacteria bacterium RIFOXYA12_FULL_61_12]
MKIFFVVVIFVLGMGAVGAMNGVFSYTNEMDFCTSCHSMKTNLEEYQETVHFRNASGVRATCSDCHVPKSFFPKLAAKIVAVRDIYHELAGTIDTKEKYDARRWHLANRVWDRMKQSDSRECRTCHAFDSMDFSAQNQTARKKHPRAKMEGKTCIDCHQGIAHIQPDEPDLEEKSEEKTEDKADAGQPSAETGKI